MGKRAALLLFRFHVDPCMEKIHAFYGWKTGKYGGGKMSGDHSAKGFQMLISVLKTHLCTMERILHIEDVVVRAEIIIKNASGSNNNIFFSVIHIAECFMFLGLGQSVRHYQYVIGWGILFQIGLHGIVVREYDHAALTNMVSENRMESIRAGMVMEENSRIERFYILFPGGNSDSFRSRYFQKLIKILLLEIFYERLM